MYLLAAEIAVINLSNELDVIYFGRIPALLVVSVLSAGPDASSCPHLRVASHQLEFPSLRRDLWNPEVLFLALTLHVPDSSTQGAP